MSTPTRPLGPIGGRARLALTAVTGALVVAGAVLALGVPTLSSGPGHVSDSRSDRTPALTYPVQGLDHCVPADDPRALDEVGPCQQRGAWAGTR